MEWSYLGPNLVAERGLIEIMSISSEGEIVKHKLRS